MRDARRATTHVSALYIKGIGVVANKPPRTNYDQRIYETRPGINGALLNSDGQEIHEESGSGERYAGHALHNEREKNSSDE